MSKKDKKETKKKYRSFLDFYPTYRIFHYINKRFFGNKNNNTLFSKRYCKIYGIGFGVRRRK